MNKFDLLEEISSRPIPLPHENFEEYFQDQNEMDYLFNEALAGLQDLDVPSGYSLDQQNMNNHKAKHSRQQSGTAIFGFSEHNRELSITGISGDLYKPGKSVDFGKSIAPGDLMTSFVQHPNEFNHNDDSNFSYGEEPKPILLLEEDEFAEENQQLNNLDQSSPVKKPIATPSPKKLESKSPSKPQPPRSSKQNEYYVTNENPRAYRFPPSPSPSPSPTRSRKVDQPIGQTYSAQYLQQINNQNKNGRAEYVDDIEPLLTEQAKMETSSETNIKFIPIPIQEPMMLQNKLLTENQLQQQRLKQQQDQLKAQFYEIQKQQQQLERQQLNMKNNFDPTYLPPPLTNSSTDWHSSPEPTSPSPSKSLLRQDTNEVSPVHLNLKPTVNFYTPQYFPEQNNYQNVQLAQNYVNQMPPSQYQTPVMNGSPQQQHPQHPFQQGNFQLQSPQQQQLSLNSSPVRANLVPHQSPFKQLVHQSSNPSLNSSPVKYFSSPGKNYDDTEDLNATITQFTPLKNQPPNTPTRNRQVQIEWSPVISPDSKTTVQKQIKDTSPRRRIKKTSLLPPGELDHYWEGPDENKIYTCNYKNCGKKFTRRYNVRSHIQTHLSDRPFGCTHCPKRFVRQHDLNRHVKGHLEARHCKCSCGKEFARLDALKKHQERNICIGGLSKTNNNRIMKPQKKNKDMALDILTSEKLEEQLSSEIGDDALLVEQSA
ncbi:Cell wall transcription factor ACE2 [Spathaspora sp. JA1]|nr:Cell wall transcription factor ACE2 [Spathaspora sp. JA1]